MSTTLQDPPIVRKPFTSSRKRKGWDRFGGKFLVISVLAHVLFGVVAAYFVVQVISAKHKLTFKGGPPSPNPSQRAIEHKVQMAKKQNTMSAPAQSKRIVTTGLAKIALPDMPAMPSVNSTAPTKMAGMGGTGIGLGPSMGVMGAGGGAGGGAIPFFGLRTANGGLQGGFYDLKQTPSRQPSDISDLGKFVRELDKFLKSGWNETLLAKYFKAPVTLSATQIFVPEISSSEAPKAFGVEKEVKPALWMALYKCTVSPPSSGTYHFVGGGDNILSVRLKGSIVLDKSWDYKEVFGIDKEWQPVATYAYNFPVKGGFAKGQALELSADEYYDMEILIGDDGGACNFNLLVEKEGVTYQKTKDGLPILPLFRTANVPPPPGKHPPFMPDGPVWKMRAPSNSLFPEVDSH